MEIKLFEFNPLQVNTVILYDETLEAVIIDPACQTQEEQTEITDFIAQKHLKPTHVLITHPHVDHVCGLQFITYQYHIPWYMHQEGEELFQNVSKYGLTFGVVMQNVTEKHHNLIEGDQIHFGNQTLQVIYTPGHAKGSVCYYQAQDGVILTGDALFRGSVGRTDLPTGNFNTLIEALTQKIMILPEATVVIPGHGPLTTIAHEQKYNPYL